MGIPIHGNLCKHLFEEHRSPVLIRDALKSIGVLFSARVSELSRTKRTVKSHGEKIPWLNTAVHFWFCSRPAQMFSLTVYSGLFSTCVRPPTTTRFSNFGTSPDPHTQVFCGGGIHLYRGPLQPRRSRESFIAQERVLLHTICEPVVTHRLRMKLTRPTNIFTSKGITGIAHIVCTIVERQCCAKRYYACTLHIAMLHKSWHGWANLLLGDWLVRPTWWVCFEFWCWTTVGMWWGTWRVFLEDTGAPSFQPSRKSKMRFNF